MRLIDANDVKRRGDCYPSDIRKVISNVLSHTKTVKDAVVVIRCKDCKYYEIWQLKADYTDDKRYKPSVCTIGKYSVHRSPDWYCADAERRTDEIG